MIRRPLFLQGPPRRETGATLVVALIVLVLIMMIGIMAITSSDTQYRLAANLQYEDVSMNNAEAAVQAGEQWLLADDARRRAAFTAPTQTHLLPILAADATAAQRAERGKLPFTTDWGANGVRVVLPGEDAATDVRRYYIELMSENSSLQGSNKVIDGRISAACNKVNTYQITARGVAARGATKYVQSYFGVLNC